jgi:hypothetical protein
MLILIQTETPGSKRGFVLMFPVFIDTLRTLLGTGRSYTSAERYSGMIIPHVVCHRRTWLGQTNMRYLKDTNSQ